jgi:hypothetical protein
MHSLLFAEILARLFGAVILAVTVNVIAGVIQTTRLQQSA